MRKLILFLILFSFCFVQSFYSQKMEIRSEQLDRIIWDLMNDRLVTLGKEKIKDFKEGPVREFAYRTCERLIPEDAVFEHSIKDSISWYSGGECIYSFSQISTGSNDYIHLLTNNNLDPIAKLVVDGWMD